MLVFLSQWRKHMINRSAIVVRYKEPFIQWINEVNPHPDEDEITSEEANTDATVYLITPADAANIEHWIELNYESLLEEELEDWYADPEVWPKNIDQEMFEKWLEIEVHSIVQDTVGGTIHEDEVTELPDKE